jgi:hypothetical protein
MKNAILMYCLLLCHCVWAQDDDRFKNFQGIKHPENNVDYFEAEGYDIFIQTVDNGQDEKGIAKIKKRYSVKDAELKMDSVLGLNVLLDKDHQGGIDTYSTYYLIPGAAKKTTVVGFVRAKNRDTGLERDFVERYRTNRIPSFIYTKLEIDSIDFVGRTLKLGRICNWMSPHNIQCSNYGQMNWAIFDDLRQAEEYRDTHFQMTKHKNLVNVKEEKWITLKFEGQETKALRTKVKIQLPKLVMGGSNILIVYYVTGQVRGKYVTCVLSHYSDDVGASKLPPLLREVLELIE